MSEDVPCPGKEGSAPDLDHGLGDASLPVRGAGGRGLRMSPAPQALEDLDARLGLVFPEAPGGRNRVSMSVTVERQKEPLVSVS